VSFSSSFKRSFDVLFLQGPITFTPLHALFKMLLKSNFVLLAWSILAVSLEKVSARPFRRSGSSAQPAAATTGAVLLAQADTTSSACVSAITVTVTATATFADSTGAVTVSVGSAATTAAAASNTNAVTSQAGADFGSCTIPEIEFGDGFDGRKETSFQPVDQTSYNHGSADNIAIITQFMCDTLTNSCKANQAAKNLCATATTAANGATAKTGAQADAFNAVFGIQTDFAAVAEIDDQGNVVSPGTGAAATTAPVATASVAAASAATTSAATSVASQAAASATATSVSAGSGIGNFGSCTVPQIKFAVGFDGRKETSFEPVDQVSYNHGSADNIDIITQFMCNTLTNTCGADATAKATCAKAEAAADTAAAGTGGQADAFNAVFGIKTDFAAVQEIDNQGRPVGAATSVSTSSAATATSAAVNTGDASSSSAASSNNSATSSNEDATSTSSAATAGNLQTFTGALGGVTPPTVTAVGNGQFQVTGNDVFNNQQSAIERSCDVQNNLCADAANASGNKNGFTVAACNAQQTQCNAAN